MSEMDVPRPMSERDRRILDELEHDLRSWSLRRRLVTSTVTPLLVVAGAVAVLVGMMLANAAGVISAVCGYVLTVLVLERSVRSRAIGRQLRQLHAGAR